MLNSAIKRWPRTVKVFRIGHAKCSERLRLEKESSTFGGASVILRSTFAKRGFFPKKHRIYRAERAFLHECSKLDTCQQYRTLRLFDRSCHSGRLLLYRSK